MKAKIKREGNKLDITIKGNTFTKYLNKCILCGNESIDDVNKGTKHICDKCYNLFETNKLRGAKTSVPTEKIVKVAMGFVDKEKKRVPSKYNTIMSKIGNYKPSIKVVNLIDFQNLMNNYNVRLNGKVMTVIVDMIIKGINTANKMARHLGITEIKTINSLRTYLARMERFAMISHIKRTDNEKPNDNIFSIRRSLVYTQC